MEPKNIVKPHANNQNSQQSHQKCMKGVNQVPWPQKKHTACKYLATFTNYLHTNLMSLLTMELRSFNELKETLSYMYNLGCKQKAFLYQSGKPNSYNLCCKQKKLCKFPISLVSFDSCQVQWLLERKLYKSNRICQVTCIVQKAPFILNYSVPAKKDEKPFFQVLY